MVRWCFRCGRRMSVQAQRRDSRGYLLVCEVASCASILRLPLCFSIEVMQSRCQICSESQLTIQLVSIVLAGSQEQYQGCLMGCNSIQIRRMLQDANHLMSESELFSRVQPQRVSTTVAPFHRMQQAPGASFYVALVLHLLIFDSLFAALLPSFPESSPVENFSSFVGPKKPVRLRDTSGAASLLPRPSNSSLETVPCPSCKAPQGVRTSKTQANPDRQVPTIFSFNSCPVFQSQRNLTRM